MWMRTRNCQGKCGGESAPQDRSDTLRKTTTILEHVERIDTNVEQIVRTLERFRIDTNMERIAKALELLLEYHLYGNYPTGKQPQRVSYSESLARERQWKESDGNETV